MAVKLTPILVLPAMALVAPRRWRPVGGDRGGRRRVRAALPARPARAVDQVAGYHLDRGVHAESLWGSLALLSRVVADADVEVVSAFGAVDIHAAIADSLKTLSNIAALGVLVDSAMTRARPGAPGRRRPPRARRVRARMILLAAVGRVFSPQYLVWLVAPMAIALTVAPRALRWPGDPARRRRSLLAHVVYPWAYNDYVAVRGLGRRPRRGPQPLPPRRRAARAPERRGATAQNSQPSKRSRESNRSLVMSW